MADALEVTITTPPTPAEAPKEEPKEAPQEELNEAQEGAEEVSEGAEEGAQEGAPEEGAAEEIAEAAGIDIAAVEAHFLEHGEVPADLYEKVSKVGVTKEMVDEFVQYRVAQADRIREEMLSPYGGEEVVSSMIDWASKNWTEDQAKTFNEAVNSGNKGLADMALKTLKADFDKKNGVKPALLKPTNSPAASNGGSYASMAELMADQRDPRYRTDPAFRERVMAKLARSNI